MAALTTSGARKASEIVEERFPKPLQNRDPEHLQRSPSRQTRLLDEADDLKLLRCGEPHVWSATSSKGKALAGGFPFFLCSTTCHFVRDASLSIPAGPRPSDF